MKLPHRNSTRTSSMVPFSLPCPHCGAVLKIRDEKWLGRRVKCPKCAQSFLLEVPTAENAPLPQEPIASTPENQAAETIHAAANPFDAIPQWPLDTGPRRTADKVRHQQQKHRRQFLITTLISAFILLVAGTVGLFVYHSSSSPPTQTKTVSTTITPPSVEIPQDQQDEEIVTESEKSPIDLQYIPAGTRMVIFLRPAELWGENARSTEFRKCLAPISEFAATAIRELAKREPTQIREAMFSLISGERGTAPDLAAVFHLSEEAKKSELLDQFSGRRVESSGGTPYYVTSENRAYFFPNLQTIAVCPEELAEEMVFAVKDRNPTSEGVQEVLAMTDRNRPVTVILEPVSARIDAEFLIPPAAVPFFHQFLEWFGPEAETLAGSLQWKDDNFQTEVIVRNRGGQSTRKLEQELHQNLESLAKNILRTVEQYQPHELGKRRIIGRFPVMTRAFTLATQTKLAPRTVTLKTQLPERAAPNMALGALLTWDESLVPANSRPKTSPIPKDSSADRMSLAQKLQRKITVEFRKTPLQVAFETIAEEIQAQVVIDGEGLKLSAYTKNMEQNFQLENVPAIDVIRHILQQPMYEKMCLVIDETQSALLITTYPAAEQQGLKPYEFAK